jgi:Adenylate and Guanylate cyclase catalytic domain
VTGRKRFLYDLWGDAVNTASRMESHGMPGRIQITRATYELLADEFECDPRGTIAVKGKGEIESWYLIGPRGDRGASCQRRCGSPVLAERWRPRQFCSAVLSRVHSLPGKCFLDNDL